VIKHFYHRLVNWLNSIKVGVKKHFLLQNLGKYRKIKDTMSFLRRIWKKIFNPKTVYNANQENIKKNLQSDTLYLDSQSIKKRQFV